MNLLNDSLVGLRLNDGRMVTKSTAKTIWLSDGTRHRLKYLKGRVGASESERDDESSAPRWDNAWGILTYALFRLATAKKTQSRSDGFFRGSPATQVILRNSGTRLYLYEAGYRDTIYPRLWWWIGPHHPDHSEAVLEALLTEVDSKLLVAQIDSRPPATIKERW